MEECYLQSNRILNLGEALVWAEVNIAINTCDFLFNLFFGTYQLEMALELSMIGLDIQMIHYINTIELLYALVSHMCYSYNHE